jgi:hypothetical protein
MDLKGFFQPKDRPCRSGRFKKAVDYNSVEVEEDELENAMELDDEDGDTAKKEEDDDNHEEAVSSFTRRMR